MALYSVSTKPRKELMGHVRQELDPGKISKLGSFVEVGHHGLDSARIDDNYARWKKLEQNKGQAGNVTVTFET